jgi:hypothetical protein
VRYQSKCIYGVARPVVWYLGRGRAASLCLRSQFDCPFLPRKAGHFPIMIQLTTVFSSILDQRENSN